MQQNIVELERLQAGDNKDVVRHNMVPQAIAFLKAHNLPLVYLGLPGTAWIFERMMLDACNKNNVALRYMRGFELEANKFKMTRIPMILKSACKKGGGNVHLLNSDIDGKVREWAYKRNDKDERVASIIWADYCGYAFNPGAQRGKRMPHLTAFVSAAQKAVQNGSSMLYYMTFNCGSRIIGGVDRVIEQFGNGSVSSVETAITSRITTLLCSVGIKNKVQLVFRAKYKGGLRSDMITIGYAVNATNIPEKIELSLQTRQSTVRPVARTYTKPTTNKLTGTAHNLAVTLIKGGKYNNDIIAQALSKVCSKEYTKFQIASVRVWVNHRSSWETKSVAA